MREKIADTLFLVVIFAGLFGIVPQHFYNARTIPPKSEEVRIDWEEMYPFADDSRESAGGAGNEAEALQAFGAKTADRAGILALPKRLAGVLDKYASLVGKAEEKSEDILNDNFPFRRKLIEANGRIMKISGIKKVTGSVVDMGDGQLGLLYGNRDTRCSADKVNEFAVFLAEEDIPFLHVIEAQKIKPGVTHIAGYPDHSNSYTDRYLKFLDGGINVLDLRRELGSDFDDYTAQFFKTDHHWLPKTGMWAAGKIAAELDKNYGFDIDPEVFDPDRYGVETYENWLLGSLGKKVSLGYTEADDLDVYYPLWETALHVTVPSMDVDVTGSYYDSMVYHRVLNEKHLYDWDAYWAYGYGDKALIKIDNLNIENGKKLLIVKDSFADTVYPFLALGVDEIDVIDKRHFTGSLKTYIKETRPDMVVFMAASGNIMDGEIPGRVVFSLD